MQGEIKMTIEGSELIVTDTHGTDMIVEKYETMDGFGIIRERLQIFPAEASEHDNSDEYKIDIPVSDLGMLVDFIKNNYLIDDKKMELGELK